MFKKIILNLDQLLSLLPPKILKKRISKEVFFCYFILSSITLQETNPFVVDLAAPMSGTGAKKRLSRVPTFGSVSSGSSHKIKKPPGGAKLSSNGVALKGSGSGQVVGQFNSMNTNGEASEGEGVSNSKMNTPQAKRFNNGVIVGSPLSSINFNIEEEKEVSFLLCKSFSLDKMWIDPKIIKTQVEVAVKKSFALDINLLAVEGKSATAKTYAIRKLFSKINGFGGVTTPSKFEGIIRFTFTFEASMEKAVSLARENNIIVNSNLKRQGIRSNRAVVIKEIPMDTPKDMIIAAVSEFGEIKSIKIQLIGMWQKAVVEFAKPRQAKQLASKWSFLIGKTCVINCSLETGNRTHCVVVCFESNEAMESAFHMKPIFGSVKLSWARLDLVRCKQYGKFGYSALECDAEVVSAFQSPKSFKKPANLDIHLQLAKLYAKKKVLISRPVAFGGKSWAQVVSVASVSHGSCDGSGSGSLSFGASSSGGTPPPLSMVDSPLGTRLACLKHSVELLSNRILNILLGLDNLSLVPSASSSSVISSVGTPHPFVSDSLMINDSDLGSNMVLDVPLIQPISFSSGNDNSQLGLSSSKVLTFKIGVLESKLAALDASIGLILAKLEQMCAGLGPLVLSSSQ
ncbi:hypothetical protein G9A89_003169 [Geosiphon pyriformis]|nr:hypothetical protein G9A89_003169 [Geosiphon pyriformis]